MIASLPASWPNRAVLWIRWTVQLMEVVLHLGVHRTGTTTFHQYLDDQRADLACARSAYWVPPKNGQSLFPGLFRKTFARKGRNVMHRAIGRIGVHAAQMQKQGMEQLLISDQGILGSCAQNLRSEQLYPGAGERTARLVSAFSGGVQRIILSIRAPDLWWASACASTVSRGYPVPAAARYEAIANSRRSWRDVITDIACAAPEAEITVLPFESYAGRPEHLLTVALGRSAVPDAKMRWLNRSPDARALRRTLREQGTDPDVIADQDGRWQPFNPDQTARLRENYADDLHWLIAGADGLATLKEDQAPIRAPHTAPPGFMTKGQAHDQGHMAQDG